MNWKNEEQLVILWNLEGGWLCDDLTQASRQFRALKAEVDPFPVDSIIDARCSDEHPSACLGGLSRFARLSRHTVVVGATGFQRVVFDILANEYQQV